MNIRKKLYAILVNRHPGITYRYHKKHDGTAGIYKFLSWLYLLWLNFAYYFLFFRFLGKKPVMEIYEEKRLNIKMSESQAYLQGNPDLSVDAYLEKLKEYEVISFDIFDTLIFRPFSQPADVFYLIGEQLDVMDFRNIRIWAERDARLKCYGKNGHTEVTLEEIWSNLREDVGNMADGGMKAEMETEEKLCYANPFMLSLWNKLLEMDKKLIVVSDMYLPKACIARILENAGYTGVQKIYISCNYRKSKADGKLYREVIRDVFGKSSRNGHSKYFPMIHVGDNPHSDELMAKRAGIRTLPYPGVNCNLLTYRSGDMSYLVGSAYRGLVSNHLYNGSAVYSMEYEYGYIYGGLFVLGYCSFIHDYCQKNQIDMALFLSRDGDILKQAYDILYPGNRSEYVYWSRKAAVKLMAGEDKHDYFRRFIYHKVNQGITLAETIHSMELDFLLEELGDWKEIWKEWHERWGENGETFMDLRPEDELTDSNGYLLRRFMEAKWDKILNAYETQRTAAKKYYGDILSRQNSAAAVDIGWAGSGALSLMHLVEKVWRIPCRITGIIAGTNTIHNAEPDASETFLQNGRLTAYMYSQSHNRELLKKHDPGKGYNIYWELLLSSPSPQFWGFYEGDVRDGIVNGGSTDDIYRKDLDITLAFGKCDINQEGIKEIGRGILDFVRQYQEHFADFPYMFLISGRDAYAPMLVAGSYKERYLKAIKKKFNMEEGIG